jgi:hypothetical protein
MRLPSLSVVTFFASLTACTGPEGEDYWDCMDWYEDVGECDNCNEILQQPDDAECPGGYKDYCARMDLRLCEPGEDKYDPDACDTLPQSQDDWRAGADDREEGTPECE